MRKWRLMGIATLFMLLPIATWAAEARRDVIVERVVPNKILYSLNENASAAVWIKNSGSEAAQGTLVAYETRGLDAQRKVATVNIALAPGEERKNVSISWNVGPRMYGRELRVDFVSGGKTISSASEFFQVADLWLRVNLVTAWKPADFLPQDLGLFETYNNHGMQFAWAPDDFSDLTPETDTWYSGQVMYHKSTEGMKADIKDAHAKGIKISTYAKYMFGGSAGFEFARRHPEWVLREEDGSFFNYSSPISPLDLAKPVTERQPFWQYGVVDFSDAAAVEYGAREIAASAKIFGWDGVMFDGHFFAHGGYSWDGMPAGHGKSLDELSARNTRLCRDIIRKEFPNFSFWYNGTYRLTADKKLELIIAGGPQTMQACLEDPNSSMLVEKQGPQFVTVSWRHWYDWYAEQPGYGEVVQKYSSPVNSGWLWNMEVLDGLTPEEAKAARGAWVAANHMGAIFLAFNLHPCWNTTYASRPFAQFMTRYSALLWDTGIKRIEAEKTFRVKSTRELWWKKSAYVKDTYKEIVYPVLNSPDFAKASSGETLYLLHLLNTPTTEKPVWKIPDDPPAASDVEVDFRAPAGEAVEKAWALRPYQWDETERSPVQVELEMEKITGGVKVKVPAFHYYTLVAFKLKK